MTEPTILLAHHDPERLHELTLEFSDRGFHVLGPAQRAGVALALAMQSPVSFAVVGERLAGARDGRALAQALRETWGVPTYILKDELEDEILKDEAAA
jgi:hypothetical protein